MQEKKSQMSTEKSIEEQEVSHSEKPTSSFDYDHVNSVARIALYDDLLSAPRVTEVTPAPTGEFIDKLSTSVYEQAKASGGTIPYTVIREVSENFIHARFNEATVSILNGGNTIRFSDQGPGIPCKDRVQLPGFSSAIEPMKRYIRGVGSGLPIVREYLDYTGGTISIEDNLGAGSVVTISAAGVADEDDAGDTSNEPIYQVADEEEVAYPYHQQIPQHAQLYQGVQGVQGVQTPQSPYAGIQPQGIMPGQAQPQTYQQPIGMGQPAYPGQPIFPATMQQPMYAPQYQEAPTSAPVSQSAQNASVLPIISSLTQRERDVLKIFKNEKMLGVKELNQLANIPSSSASVTLTKLEQAGLLVKTASKKRILTDIGAQVVNLL